MLTPVLLASLLTLAPAAAQDAVPSPEDFLGRPAASDFTLTNWDELSGYYRALADASPNVRLETIGTSHDGRDFLLAVIGSEANLARLGELEALARRVADPRGLSPAERDLVLDSAVPFLFVSPGMHSTECAAWDFGMEFAHRLATSDEEPYASARENLVVYMPPCLNPDGVDRVSSWYREHVGTPYEGTSLLELYQEYAGHDNNRDWFGLTLQETRVVTTALYGRIFPQVYWDIHQQGGDGERFFVPGYRDPLNPNVDANVVLGADLLGTRALFDMTAEGLTGIATGVTYDMWWNGGNRNVPARHNIVGILTEAASCNLGSPQWRPLSRLSAPGDLPAYQPSNRFVKPWPGGWWRLRDIVDYTHGFGRSLIASMSREPRVWLENTMNAALANVERGRTDSPRAFVIPPDDRAGAQRARLLDNLMMSGVEIHRAESELVADGRTWPAGSIVIDLAQPYGGYARDLLEAQDYPEGAQPYDVAGWTLPALFGVRAVEVHGAYEGQVVRAESVAGAQKHFAAPLEGTAFHDLRDGTSFVRAFGALGQDVPVALVPTPNDGPLALAMGGVDVMREGAVRLRDLPRIGVYAPWSGVKNEGWLRAMLDRYGIPYTRVRPETLRGGELDELFDVLVLPSIGAGTLLEGRSAGTVPTEYTRGIGTAGLAALETFVDGGGRLVAMESSALAAIELLDLPVQNTARGGDFACPGSVLRTVSRDEAWDAPAVLFAGGAAFEASGDAQVLVAYASERPLLSGWIRGEEAIAGKGWLVRVDRGEGDVYLFGCRPQYRGWSEHAFLALLQSFLMP